MSNGTFHSLLNPYPILGLLGGIFSISFEFLKKSIQANSEDPDLISVCTVGYVRQKGRQAYMG